jgi:hypothetical protein
MGLRLDQLGDGGVDLVAVGRVVRFRLGCTRGGSPGIFG